MFLSSRRVQNPQLDLVMSLIIELCVKEPLLLHEVRLRGDCCPFVRVAGASVLMY